MSVIVVFLLVGMGLLFQLNWNPISGQTDSKRVHDLIEEDTRFQWLVMLESDGNLDSVYLFSFEPISRNLAGIYIPAYGKLHSDYLVDVHSLEELHRELTPEELRDELEQALDVSIPFWVSLSQRKFSSLVDLIGGTRIHIGPTELGDRDLPPPENRWMDGSLAVQYQAQAYEEHGLQGLRFRNKTLFMGILDRLGEQPGLLEDERFREDVHQLMETNFQPDDWSTLIRELEGLGVDDIQFLAARERTGLDSREMLEASRFHQMFPRPLQEIISEADPQELIRVQLLNGAGVTGLASYFQNNLQPYADIDIVDVDNADHFNYEVTRVVDRSDNPQSAYRLQQLMNLGQMDTNIDDDALVDVTIILGRDAVEFMEGEGF